MRTRILRLTLTSILVCAAAQTVVAQQDWDAIEMKVHSVSGNVSYIEGSGGNIGLFTGDDGVFLIDDQYAPLTDKIVAAIRTVSSEPIRFLVNTHMHPDHVGGNENFGKNFTGHLVVRAKNRVTTNVANRTPALAGEEQRLRNDDAGACRFSHTRQIRH